MTKEEKIKEAWGEYYDRIKCDLDEHGRYNYYDNIAIKRKSKLWQFENIETHEITNTYLLIPSSIKGIENNNGWIKIESEEDLPKENGVYFIKDKFRNFIYTQSFEEQLSKKWLEVVTHYQPIEKPKPPIY